MPEAAPDRQGRSEVGVDAELVSALVVAVRRFTDRRVDALAHDRAGALPAWLLDEARALGLFGLAIPEVYGGLGLGLGPTSAVIAELARADRSLAVTVGLHNGLGTRPLVESGTEAQRSAWLPTLASGERIASFAATEPEAGSDLTAMRTRACRDGDRWRLDGEKAYVTNAALAGVVTVLARVPDEGALATGLFVVPRGTPGLTLGHEERKLGLRASSTCSIHFDAATVDPEHRIGTSGSGVDHAHRALEWGRTLMSAGCLGTARAALELTLAYARQRRQFGRTLVELGAVRGHLATMASAVTTIEAMLGSVGRDDAAAASIVGSSAALKVHASELAFDVCDRAIQVHGALGFVEDAGIAILARDCRVTRIFEGANDVLLLRLGTALLAGRGLPHTDASDLDGAAGDVRLALDRTVRAIRDAYGVTAIQRQPLVLALARADVALFAASCCLSEARAASGQRAALLRHAARRALDQARAAVRASDFASTDEIDEHAIVDALMASTRSVDTPGEMRVCPS